MKTCGNCGLGIKQNDELVNCYKYSTTNPISEDKENCRYYIETIIEEGEPLTPKEHLIFKEEELNARKMSMSRSTNIIR